MAVHHGRVKPLNSLKYKVNDLNYPLIHGYLLQIQQDS